jgi:antitoxin MazE
MDAVIRKWGNSPAVRLNSAAMKIASFDIEQRVTIKASKGRIVIEPADKIEFKLEDLVAGITRENVHDEANFGSPVGKEAL